MNAAMPLPNAGAARPLAITHWPSLTDTSGERCELTWDALARWLALPNPKPKNPKKPALHGWSAAAFKQDKRAKRNVECAVAVVLDLDSGDVPLERVRGGLAGLEAIVHSSKSYAPNSPRWRVVVAVTRPMAVAEYDATWRALRDRLAASGIEIDEATKDPSRFWYAPCEPVEGDFVIEVLRGAPFEVVTRPEPAAPRSSSRRSSRRSYGEAALEDEVERLRSATNGSRNAALNRAGHALGQLVAGGELAEDLVRDALSTAAREVGLTDGEIAKTLASGLESGKRQPRSAPERPAAPAQVAGGELAPSFEIGDHVEVGAEYARSLGDDAVFDDGAMFTYAVASGTFVPLSDAEESCRVQRYSGCTVARGEDSKPKPLKLSASDVGGIIKLAHARRTHREFFARARTGLAFAECFVEVTAEGIVRHEHSPAHRARYGYPVSLADVRAPARFLAFLDEVFAGTKDPLERVELLQEFAGASLLGLAPRYQLCLVLVGDGANGKSTLIAVLKSAFPPATVVAVPPQRWDDQYRRAVLAGALLNAVSELPENDILASETFKAVISGDEIEGRHIYKPLFHFVPRAGHIFGANKLPSSSDVTHGFWRRFAVLTFPHKFEGDRADANLADRIIAEERAGVIAWMLEGAARLMRRGHYVLPASSAEVVAAWKRNSNAVALFVQDQLVALKDGSKVEIEGTFAAMLYDAFKAWAERNGHKSISSVKFGARLRELGFEPVKSKRGWHYPLRFAAGDEGDRAVTEFCHQNSRGGSDA